MKKFGWLALIVFSSLLMACQNSQKPETETPAANTELSGKLSISGAFALYPLAVNWGDAFNKANPKVQLDVQGGGTGKGITDVLNGITDIGMVSRKLTDEEIGKGAYPIAVTKDAVVPTINANNPYAAELLKRGLTKEEFADIFLNSKIQKWNQILKTAKADKLDVFTRSDACGAADAWAGYLGNKKQEDLKGTAVDGDPGLLQAVSSHELGIGFNNVGFVYDAETRKPNAGILPLPIDVNGNGTIDANENFYGTVDELNKAILDGSYPSPPARELYFVTKNKPTNPLAIAFLHWVLNDGQSLVEKSGYVKLPDSSLKEQEQKLP